jgi:uncharacterized protein YqeY
MSTQEVIQEHIKTAMKQKDSLRLDVLRGMKTAIKNKEIEKVKNLAEEEVVQVLQTLVKQRKDSIEQFSRGNRPDLAQREEAELRILQEYLPEPVATDEIQRVIKQAISELGVSDPREMGKVMKAVMGKFSGRLVDGKTVSDLVRASLITKGQ